MTPTHNKIVTLHQDALKQGCAPTAVEISLEDEAKLETELGEEDSDLGRRITRDGLRKHLPKISGLPIRWAQRVTRVV